MVSGRAVSPAIATAGSPEIWIIENVISETVSATNSATPRRLIVKASIGRAYLGGRRPALGQRGRNVVAAPARGRSSHFHFAAKNCGISSDVSLKSRSLE